MNTSSPRRPIILTLIGPFWPGSDSAGPNQSIRGLTAALSDEFSFRRVSRDRPFGAVATTTPSDRWIEGGGELIRYCTPSIQGKKQLFRILKYTSYDILMLTSFFDREYTIPALLLRRLGLIPRRPTIVSPRGEFSPGALKLKALRKCAYIRFARATGLYNDVVMHATGDQELRDIRNAFPWAADYAVAGNVSRVPKYEDRLFCHSAGPIRLAFVGRISPVKNLHFSLQVLSHVMSNVEFRIYGLLQDIDYWRKCQKIIAELPSHIRVRYEGEIPNDQVWTALQETDLFFLPSRSENFGHAIFEALSAGVPVLIGDQTPWNNMEEREAGWDLPLDDPGTFAKVIDRFAGMGHEQRARLRSGAIRAAMEMVKSTDAIGSNRQMFLSLLGKDFPFRDS
jgi:glycosyltransferase involved in cell wall biosynthesis